MNLDQLKENLSIYNLHIIEEIYLGYDITKLKTNRENMFWSTIIIFDNRIIYFEQKFFFNKNDILIKFPTKKDLDKHLFFK